MFMQRVGPTHWSCSFKECNQTVGKKKRKQKKLHNEATSVLRWLHAFIKATGACEQMISIIKMSHWKEN